MTEQNSWDNITLGQPVYLRTDPATVAVMTKRPYEALVRWTDAEPTFEALDDLIEAIP